LRINNFKLTKFFRPWPTFNSSRKLKCSKYTANGIEIKDQNTYYFEVLEIRDVTLTKGRQLLWKH